MSFIVKGCRWVTRTFLYLPTKTVYLSGPSLGVIGGWDGLEPVNICATLTKTNERLWVANHSECQRMIDVRFESLFVVVNMIIYLFVLYQLVYLCTFICAMCIYRTAVRTKYRRLT